MENGVLINIAITMLCLVVLSVYFNFRDAKVQSIADKKLLEIKERFTAEVAARKAKEKLEISRLKTMVEALEKQHLEFLKAQSGKKKVDMSAEALTIIKKAEESAKKIEENVKAEAMKFLEEQKKEVQIKMVDLVMGVTKRAISKTLTYDDHRKVIEEAIGEVESEAVSEQGN